MRGEMRGDIYGDVGVGGGSVIRFVKEFEEADGIVIPFFIGTSSHSYTRGETDGREGGGSKTAPECFVLRIVSWWAMFCGLFTGKDDDIFSNGRFMRLQSSKR